MVVTITEGLKSQGKLSPQKGPDGSLYYLLGQKNIFEWTQTPHHDNRLQIGFSDEP